MGTIIHHNDGGRQACGYKGKRDCVVRAIAIATQLPYKEVYEDLAALNERRNRNPYSHSATEADPGKGHTKMRTIKDYLRSKGWEWVPVMGIGTGCRMHLRKEEVPKGRIICRVSKHMAAVIDGVIHDTYDCSSAGTRCVYGYFQKA